MKAIAETGRHYYGAPVGILKFEDSIGVYIPGAVCNVGSYPFPVILRPVKDLSFAKLYGKDRSVLPDLIEAVKWLDQQGVRAITAGCGFFSLYQRELAEAADVPVFLSSLLQVPFLLNGIRKNEKVGVLTADSTLLDNEFLVNSGITDLSRIAVQGMQEAPAFRSHVLEENPEIDTDAIREEVLCTVGSFLERDPSVRILLLECSELPPYAAVVQERFGLPIFDYNTMIRFLFSGTVRKPFHGFL